MRCKLPSKLHRKAHHKVSHVSHEPSGESGPRTTRANDILWEKNNGESARKEIHSTIQDQLYQPPLSKSTPSARASEL
eukprot:scaffold137874_cov30-Tisochrysis_lutea.AAC.4